MSNILSNGNHAPERGRNTSADDELMRSYCDTIFESFMLLHKMGFASDPESINAALGIPTAEQQVAPQAEIAAMPLTQEEATVFSIDNALKKAYAVHDENPISHEDNQHEKFAA